MIFLLLTALLQAPTPPLVGDTVWLAREISAPPGSLLRPLAWDPGEDALVLGPPEAVAQPGGWTLRYPLVFWRPGTHRVEMPGPLVVRPDGGTDSLPGRALTVVIGSILPAGRADTLPPRPAAGLVATSARSPWPVVVLALLAAVLLAPLHWWWRRRGPAGAAPAGRGGPAVLPSRDQLVAWAASGELRAAADGWIARLELAPPAADRDRLLDALREARFESVDRVTLEGLCAEAGGR